MVDERVLENRERWTELPHLYELEDLMAFCERYKKIYVYGKSIRQEQLVKYLEMCGVNVEGYVVSNEDMNDGVLHYKYYPVITRNEMLKKDDIGVILGLSERYYNRIIPKMRSAGFNRYFILTEYTKRTLANKIGVHEKEDIQIEINVVDHCNLNCRSCDHFSPLSDEIYLDINEYERDIQRMSNLSEGKLGVLKILGGEPLLHPNIHAFLQIGRKWFPDTCIQMFTNGILLNNTNIWEVVCECNIQVCVTRYPIKTDFQSVINTASDKGVPVIFEPPTNSGACLWICNDFAHKNQKEKLMIRFPMDKNGGQNKCDFIGCHLFNACIVIRHGRIYTCPRIAYIDIFNRYFGMDFLSSKTDSIDIYSVDSFDEIARFCAKRPHFCDYCAVGDQDVFKWGVSNRDMPEWIMKFD